MNYEGLEPKTYYDKQEQKHLDEFKCYAFGGLAFLAGCAATVVIIGGRSLIQWLLGGA